MKGTTLRLYLLLLFIIATPSLVFAAATHKVKKKETLTSLAKKYHVTVKELKTANNIVDNHIKPGDLIVIPPRSVAADDTKSAKKGKAEVASYTVKKGDTLLRIARITGVSVNELRRLNNLKSKHVKPGTQLALRREPVEDVKESRETKPVKVAKVKSLTGTDLFDESEYERTLSELSSFDPDKSSDPNKNSVDLSKTVDLSLKHERDENASLLKKKAFSFLGIRYRFGGSGRDGIDCSSFVQQVFREMNISLPRTAREQYTVGNLVSPANLQKGDLVFFQTYARYASHVGIYLGGNKMIHASSRDRRVVISTINTPYYLSRFLGAKRIAKINPDIFNFSDLLTGVEEEKLEDILENDTLDVVGSK